MSTIKVRVKEGGGDVVVRHAGRRLRITEEWGEVNEDAAETLWTEERDRLEFAHGGGDEGAEPEPFEPAPPAPTNEATTAEAAAETETPKPEAQSRAKGKTKAGGK